MSDLETTNPEQNKKEIEFDGYNFTVDMSMLDDVEMLEILDRIENRNQIGAIIPLLKLLITDKGYDDMKAYFVGKYGKFKATTLVEIYRAMIAKYDPKD